MYITLNELNKKKLEEDFIKCIEGMDLYEQYGLWNDYCDNMYYYDDMVYVCDKETINELCDSMKPSDIIEKFGNVDFSWDYMIFTWEGVEEWTGIDTYSIRSIVNYIMDMWEDLGSDKIADIMDMWEAYDEEGDE